MEHSRVIHMSLIFSLGLAATFFTPHAWCFSELTPPPSCLLSIPYAEISGLVKKEKTLHINGVRSAYNSSLVQIATGYLLFFRQDCPKSIPSPGYDPVFRYRIGVARLDHNFNHIDAESYFFPELTSYDCIDPRAFRLNEKIYILLYLLRSPSHNVLLATVNEKTLSLESVTPLAPQVLINERNWIPLVPSSTNNDTLPFIHTIYQRIEGTINLSTGSINYSSNPQGKHFQEIPFWKWGTLSGGTHAIELEDMYLCFFHSFVKIPKRCYVMGACTFSKDSNHRLMAISRYPIITKNMYASNDNGKMGPIDCPRYSQSLDRVIFPCGAVLTKDDNGDEVFIVSCGENDMATRILTIDKHVLIQSLQSL